MTHPVRAQPLPRTDGDPLVESAAATTIRCFLETAQTALEEARSELHDLDAVLGDGDHGDAITAGFSAAHQALDTAPEGPGPMLDHAGRALAETMGGAAGPLYATVLRSLAAGIGDTPQLELADVAAGVRRAADEVARRGRVCDGDGSLLDALEPAATTLEHHAARSGQLPEALDAAAAAADRGAIATTDRPKRRGRASSHPSQGVGAQDPGARSLAIVIRALAESVTSEQPHHHPHHHPRETQR